MSAYRILYFNGLTNGVTRKREALAIDYLERRGARVTHVPVNWFSGESFEELLARMVAYTEAALTDQGKLILVGASAGGSLVLNILGRLHNKNLYAVTLCSRIHESALPWWDKRTLRRMAYIGKSKESRSFFDSVVYCGTTTIPSLSTAEKHRIITVVQWADDVVPRQTMQIKGVRTYRVSAFGHGWGIAMATRRLPEIATDYL
ncbi:MAG TPA: hypothetical protein VLH38_01130 [Patescibacteria group bacterium]|nr:hypothetical protein [Patescibacteria group bacterium]